eukprot:m.97683 g.97683  ORF g.97683 m.97683 type:complete len:168 (+) comp16724_c0_seq2:273-776(+)
MDFFVRAEDSEMSADDIAMGVEQGVIPTPQAMMTSPNTIRITLNGKLHSYVAVGRKLLEASPETGQLTVKGEGRAVTKAISVAEILKHRVHGLHQVTTIGMATTREYWDPKPVSPDGTSSTAMLDSVQVSRKIPTVEILLSLAPVDPATLGYQPPLPHTEVDPDGTS